MTSHTTTILAVAGPALAHLTRVLAVADVLRASGVTIHVATDGTPWIPIAAQRGHHVEHLPEIVDGARLGGGSLALPPAVIRAALEADLSLLRRLRPRLVLLDFRPSMRLAAALCDIPVVALVNPHVTRHYRGPLAAPEQHPITRIFGRRVADRLMPVLAPLFFRQWARPYQVYARTHGHDGWPDLRDYLTGDTTLYADLPSLAPATPGSGSYIGPLVNYPLPTEPLPRLRDPVLYVTTGSAAIGASKTPMLVEAVGSWPGSVVATRGGWACARPHHWISVDYADPWEIVRRGHRIAWVFHGGNGSSYQILQQWVRHPTSYAGAVALPYHVEQQWNAEKLAALGAIDTIGSLHQLDDRIRQAIRRLQTAEASPPPATLIDEMTAFADAPQLALGAIQRWL